VGSRAIQATKQVDVGTERKEIDAETRTRTNMTIVSGAVATTGKRIGGATIDLRLARRELRALLT
jgi:hypothetical protein